MARSKNDPVYLWLLEQDREKNKARAANETCPKTMEPLPKQKNPWNIGRARVRLADGSTLRIETILKEVKRLNKYTSDGKPIYSVKSETAVEVLEVPENLVRHQAPENLPA